MQQAITVGLKNLQWDFGVSDVHVKQQEFIIQQLRCYFELVSRHATAGIFTADLRTSRSVLSVETERQIWQCIKPP